MKIEMTHEKELQEILDRSEETARNYRLATATLVDMVVKHEREIEELKARLQALEQKEKQ
jgi:selenocysteine-specific translation elongation factor